MLSWYIYLKPSENAFPNRTIWLLMCDKSQMLRIVARMYRPCASTVWRHVSVRLSWHVLDNKTHARKHTPCIRLCFAALSWIVISPLASAASASGAHPPKKTGAHSIKTTFWCDCAADADDADRVDGVLASVSSTGNVICFVLWRRWRCVDRELPSCAFCLLPRCQK